MAGRRPTAKPFGPRERRKKNTCTMFIQERRAIFFTCTMYIQEKREPNNTEMPPTRMHFFSRLETKAPEGKGRTTGAPLGWPQAKS